jgi:hypothetical protein
MPQQDHQIGTSLMDTHPDLRSQCDQQAQALKRNEAQELVCIYLQDQLATWAGEHE